MTETTTIENTLVEVRLDDLATAYSSLFNSLHSWGNDPQFVGYKIEVEGIVERFAAILGEHWHIGEANDDANQ